MRNDALSIAKNAILSSLPYENTLKLLSNEAYESVSVIALGKAAVPMASAAVTALGDKIKKGLLITKYNHSTAFSSELFEVIESGHPISDDNSIIACEKALALAEALTENDTLLVLLSGGGSALAEKSIIDKNLYREISEKLLFRGADISEINTIRKSLSLIKGGKLAMAAFPAKVVTLALSDVLSNDKGIIASAPTVKDTTDSTFRIQCVKKYLGEYEEELLPLMMSEKEGFINDGGYFFTGDINILCDSAEKYAESLGYEVHSGRRDILGDVRDEIPKILESIPERSGRHCYIFGGECTVNVSGNGKGGRNQEAALIAAIMLRDRKDIAFLSIGSDGTDGPTDAAGGFADCDSYKRMCEKGISPENELNNNNSYHALSAADDLIITGQTGTNVNDIIIILTDSHENS